jgi:gamma-glutamylcyclotransferase (GGCT)/AIG2-like uncharacterized protein YtfP
VQTPGPLQLIDLANAARRRGGRDPGAEAQLERLYGTSGRLAVYGSLAPGRENHHVVAPLGGTWASGVVEGDLRVEGWGAALGYPALRLRRGGPAMVAQVLASEALRGAWPELDAFEGPEYRRVLVPVWKPGEGARALLTVANLYEASAVAAE